MPLDQFNSRIDSKHFPNQTTWTDAGMIIETRSYIFRRHSLSSFFLASLLMSLRKKPVNVVTSWTQFRFFNVKKCEEECQLRELFLSHILIRGHPRRVTPRTYGGMAWDLLTLVPNFKPGMWGLYCFCTFVTRSLGKDRGIHFAAAILEIELETLLMGVIITMR